MLKFKCLLASRLKKLSIHDRQILLDVKYLRGSPKRALSFETEARDYLASWLEIKPVFASKDPLSFFRIR